MSSDENDFAHAVKLAQQGRNAEAREIFLAVTAAEPGNDKAWLWLAACTDDDELKQHYLNRVLLIQGGQPEGSEPLPMRQRSRINEREPEETAARRSFWKEYWLEMSALGAVALGVFLLVEPFNIREDLQKWFVRTMGNLEQGLSGATLRLVEFVRSFTLSDMTGIILLILAGGVVLWRARVRFLNSAAWKATTCPRCGLPVVRARRNTTDRLVGGFILPHSRRYRCSNKQCGWSGLRHHRHEHGEDRPRRSRRTSD